MNLADAEQEFRLREYLWSKAEWEKEINESFPHLRMFKTGNAWNLYQFMQKLSKGEQLALAIGRLKQGRPKIASKLGEHLSEVEESTRRRFDAFFRIREHFQIIKQLRSEGKILEAAAVFDISCAGAARLLCNTDSTDAEFLSAALEHFLSSIPKSFEEQVNVRKQAGEKIKFVSKKKLQKILTEKVKTVFESECVECRIDEGHWTAFDVKCGSWMLQTQFAFGRQQSLLRYWQNVCSQKRMPHPVMSEVMYPVMFLCRGTGWPCGGKWEYLSEEDVELACDESFKYCRHFFEAAPRLLKGLDIEAISEHQ